MDANYKTKLNSIKCFVFDVDGVLTNGNLLVATEGKLLRTMNIKDGYAIQLAIKKGYKVAIISGGTDEGVPLRLKKLGVEEIHMGVHNKMQTFISLINQYRLKKEEVLYLGDDMPDLETMKHAGLACCPYDAVPQISEVCDYISPLKGGEGCVRDVIEQVLKLHKVWE